MAEQMTVISRATEMSAWASEAHRSGQTVALVPTMGNLHRGHLALVEQARQSADLVVVSIFVNPRQFGPAEDFERYPRTLEADVNALTGESVDVVFAPSVDDIYPPHEPVVSISAGEVGRLWEGAARPGHFDGVLTVCARLFELTQADVAVFGEKDAQQLFLLRQFSSSHPGSPRIVWVPTVRDNDGVALSSRNSYLSGAQRIVAAEIPKALAAVSQAIASGDDVDRALEAGRNHLLALEGVNLDYFDAVNPETFRSERTPEGDVLVIVAASVGTTRLIDNLRVRRGVAPASQ